MSIVYNIDEVLEMGLEIEKNGAAFYRQAAGNNAEIRDFLLELAAEEDKHTDTFAQMRNELTDNETVQQTWDPDDQASMYLQAMADSNIFDVREDAAAVLTGQETAEEIIDLAIQREKDSVVFYSGLKEVVPEVLGKDKVEALVKEELSHIAWLGEKRRNLA